MNTFERPQSASRARASASHRSRKWYSIANAAGDAAEILIYDEIGYWGTTADQFVKDLRAVTAATINVRINSPGGDVFDGIAIMTALKLHPATVNVHVDALAASIASVIAMAGDTVRMAPSAYLMIHNAWGLAIGDATEMRKTADLLEKINGTIADVYAARGNKTADEFKALMNAETWMTAQEAIDAGLADERAADDPDAQQSRAFDLSFFARVPEQLKANAGAKPAAANTPKTKREMEDFLRDVGGFSNAAAKAIVAGGFKESKSEPRDEDGELMATLRAHVAANIATLSQR